MPSTSLMAALAAVALIGTMLALVGLPGLMPLPWWQLLIIFVYSMVASLVVNDGVKVTMIRCMFPQPRADE